MKKLFILFCLLSAQILAQYITPNTGINWNLDDLVTNSGGTVTGTFPNYAINNKVTVSAADRFIFFLARQSRFRDQHPV